jgi:alpha-glucosidase (family GH31 glycosyl hydrolase)
VARWLSVTVDRWKQQPRLQIHRAVAYRPLSHLRPGGCALHTAHCSLLHTVYTHHTQPFHVPAARASHESASVRAQEADSSGNLFWSIYVHDSHIRHSATPELNRPMVMPRFGWLGQHRYCCGFSGDQTSEWQTLQAEVWMTATAANVGFAHWSHDVGGFRGDPTPELYLRWTQFGALSPLYRSHGTKGSNRDYWSSAYSSVFPLMRQSLALRLALAPYLYSSARLAHDFGVAAVHSLYLDWPEEAKAYDCPDVFMHGPDLLVRPVTAELPTAGPQTVSVWLPPNGPVGWVEWASSSGVVYGGNSDHGVMVQAIANLGVLPMFVRTGSVLPLLPHGALDARAVALGDAINWAVFLGAIGTAATTDGGGTFQRYFDDGDSTAYEGPNGAFARQTFTYTLRDQVLNATISAAVVNGGYTLPRASVLHSVELRGTRAPDMAIMGGSAMACITIDDKQHSLARPKGTVVCRGAGALSLDEPTIVTFRWT